MKRKSAKPSRSQVLEIERNKWRDWFSKARWFARGTYFQVFRKKETNYPTKFLLYKGNLVKICERILFPAKTYFYEAKLIHELFPENTVRVRAVREDMTNGMNLIEIHMDAVPVHEELKEYQELLANSNSSGHRWRNAKAQVCEKVMQKHLQTIDPIAQRMRIMGLAPNIDNPTNVSLANPQKPIFIEPKINSPLVLKKYLEQLRMPEPKRKRLLRYLKFYQDSLQPT